MVPGLGSREDQPPKGGRRGGAGQLVHNPVEAAYARSALFDRRRQLMNDWASMVVAK